MKLNIKSVEFKCGDFPAGLLNQSKGELDKKSGRQQIFTFGRVKTRFGIVCVYSVSYLGSRYMGYTNLNMIIDGREYFSEIKRGYTLKGASWIAKVFAKEASKLRAERRLNELAGMTYAKANPEISSFDQMEPLKSPPFRAIAATGVLKDHKPIEGDKPDRSLTRWDALKIVIFGGS